MMIYGNLIEAKQPNRGKKNLKRIFPPQPEKDLLLFIVQYSRELTNGNEIF